MWKIKWTRVMRLLLLIYIFFAIYIFFKADSLIFQPQPVSYQDTSKILKIPVGDTEKISAVYLPNDQSKYTLLYIHGNAEDLGDISPILNSFNSWGFSVFAYDYRGYGTSNGTPSEQNAYQDADAAYDYLAQQLKISPDRLIIYGRSLGGGSATELATKHAVAGLVLQSTFTSAFRVILPFPMLPFDKFTNLAKIANIHCPVMVIHGEADRTIPVEHGRSLYKTALNPKMSLWVPNADHNDFDEVVGTRFPQALQSFQKLLEQHKVASNSD
jgi:abhydrolase domain-containing protein 17